MIELKLSNNSTLSITVSLADKAVVLRQIPSQTQIKEVLPEPSKITIPLADLKELAKSLKELFRFFA
jgi:hypothetical protein